MSLQSLLSVPEAARVLGISRSGAYNLVRSGKLPAVWITRRSVRIRPADLEEFIESHLRFDGGKGQGAER